MAVFADVDLSKIELTGIEDNPAAGFQMTLLVARDSTGERFDPKRFEMPTWAGLLFRALIDGHRKQAAEIAELKGMLAKPKPSAKKGRQAA